MRSVACVPVRSGATSSSSLSSSSAWPSSVSSIFSTMPTLRPPIFTRLPLTTCVAAWKRALTVYPPPPSSTTAATSTTTTSPATTVTRPTFRPLPPSAAAVPDIAPTTLLGRNTIRAGGREPPVPLPTAPDDARRPGQSMADEAALHRVAELQHPVVERLVEQHAEVARIVLLQAPRRLGALARPVGHRARDEP